MPIRTAIIGGGLSARVFHAPFVSFNPRFKLTCFVRTKQEVVDGFESIPVETSIENVLQRQDIDAVIITSPTSLHYDHVASALNAGKHVVVEKPFAPTSREAETLVALAEDKGLVLAVYQNRRWDGDFLTVSKLISEAGGLGRVVELESRFERYRYSVRKGAWREMDLPGSGLLYDLGSHLIDQAFTLFGQPHSITAFVQNLRQLSAPTDDAFTINLHYTTPHPKLVTLKATMLAKRPGTRFTVHFTGGSYVKYGLDPQEEQSRAGLSVMDPKFGVESPEKYGTLWRADDSGDGGQAVPTLRGTYGAFYENVADAIEGGGSAALKVQPKEAANVIRLIEIAIRSSKEGRTIVV
ncbi:oxidoreductase domain-containing protein [Fimicolochytrium jonesii]|uniref:oxidoreductase domain-containing protein n=1 Tax=Fimicolochytrium jonesii TaxID=1396493 RepID=UPI0022FF427D|nr:oxidoreductase domain-containing protein [Fimicolochytrium jonesii]KAI8827012.1 oxidoreductase domain-containing protein [Fimicolochytrium jonesii]